MTSGQLQGLQQQQLQQIYLQQQQQAQQQQQGTELSSTQANATVSLENTAAIPVKNMTNHVSFQSMKGENHEHLDASQLNQPSVPGSTSQNNWSDTVPPHNGQNSTSTGLDNQLAKPPKTEVQTSTCVTTQGISNSVAPTLLTQSLPGPFTQSESLLTGAHTNSSVSAMETSIVPGDHMMQMAGHQNSIAGPDTAVLSSLSSNFVSTSSNVLLSQSVVSSQGTAFLSSESLTTGSSTTTEASLTSGMDTTLLTEINCSAGIKPSPLTGNSDPTLSNGPISTYSGFSSATGCASGMTISPFSSPSYVMSPTQKSPFHTTSTLSPSLTQPLSIINPSCLSPSSGLQGGQSTFSPSLIPADLLSPSKQLAVVSPGSSKSPFNLTSGGGDLVVPKLNLLFDANAIPHPPPTPAPPLPTDKLSPQTPIIYVSTTSVSLGDTILCKTNTFEP